MENNEISLPVVKEILPNNQDKWKNLFGGDTRQRGFGDTKSIYEPQSRSLVNQDGYSIVNPDYFLQAIITPIHENKLTEMVVPLNKIIALDTTNSIKRQNYNPDRLPWEIDSHKSVDEFRKLIRENKFDFNDLGGLYGSEFPGGYIMATGGRHRLTAMFLEGVLEVKLKVNKIKNPKEFGFTDKHCEGEIQEAIDDGKIKGKIEEDPDHYKKLVLDEPIIKNPLQLFNHRVSDKLLDVLAQTLSTD